MLCVDEIEIQIGKSYEILGWNLDCDLESLDLRIWLRWLFDPKKIDVLRIRKN